MRRKTKLLIFWTSLAVIIALCISAIFLTPKGGAKVVITQNGKEYGTYDLAVDQTIVIDNENGRNVVVIKNAAVDVIEADCYNQTCVMSAPLSEEQTLPIVCLPHELIIEIKE